MKINIPLSVSSSSNALDYFETKALDYLKEDVAAHKTRDTVLWLNPEVFLNLAETGFDSEKQSGVDRIDKFNSVVSLILDRSNKVRGHEGRHRCRKLLKNKVELLPVLIRSDVIRWSEQNSPNSFDFIPDNKWPRYIKGEDSPFKIKFPSKEYVAQVYDYAYSIKSTRLFFEKIKTLRV